ncbi:MAG: winged helix-turn-helix domain-containing protein [Conexivisphaerales archaeon]
MERKSRRRSKEEVLGEIIRAALDGAIKTRIMYRAALNSRQLKRYLQVLMKQGLLEYNDKQKVFVSTEKGKLFLARLDEFLKAKNQLQDQSKALREFLKPQE